jgi:tRNA pseudouridine38-40 synthase
MAVFKLTLAYDGTDFHGWQRQRDRRTVQGELERAWHEITGESARITGASRTDSGVHAAGQVASVESAMRLTPDALLSGLNAKLPLDAAVRRIELAPAGFHATHDAKRKRYRYSFYNDHRRPVFFRRNAWHVPSTLDIAAMHSAAQALVGTHDFASFQSAGSERESTVRTIFEAVVWRRAEQGRGGADPSSSHLELRRGVRTAPSTHARRRADSSADLGVTSSQLDSTEDGALIHFDVEGDGFLYNMVRALAGTLLEVGRGRRDADWIAQVIDARNRSAAGQTAPPHGLTLLWVAY